MNKKINTLIRHGYDLDCYIKNSTAQFKKLKDELKTLLPAGDIVLIDDICSCAHIVNKDSKISDPKKLQIILGGEFNNLVEVKKTYTPTSELISRMDSTPTIIECVEVKEIHAIKFLSQKPAV